MTKQEWQANLAEIHRKIEATAERHRLASFGTGLSYGSDSGRVSHVFSEQQFNQALRERDARNANGRL